MAKGNFCLPSNEQQLEQNRIRSACLDGVESPFSFAVEIRKDADLAYGEKKRNGRLFRTGKPLKKNPLLKIGNILGNAEGRKRAAVVGRKGSPPLISSVETRELRGIDCWGNITPLSRGKTSFLIGRGDLLAAANFAAIEKNLALKRGGSQ